MDAGAALGEVHDPAGDGHLASQRVADVLPTRLVAAQQAAKAFLSEVPINIEVGLITFAGSAQVAQQATPARPSLVSAIHAIQMQYGTAIGNGLVLCQAEVFPDYGIDPWSTARTAAAS